MATTRLARPAIHNQRNNHEEAHHYGRRDRLGRRTRWGLADCGTAQAPAAAPTVHVTQTVTPTPTPTVTKTVAPVTPKTVYVAPAAPTLTACGEGVYGEVVFAGRTPVARSR
jgi:hypothetical protein